MLITETNLHRWVHDHQKEAQVKIVELVSRLINASCPDASWKHIPLGDSTHQPGPDCFLVVNKPFNQFVPGGQSYWEIGAGSGISSKATEDYDKRTSEYPEEERHKSTFVFVTPDYWQFSWKKDAQLEWRESRLKRNEWKDIKILDGTCLVDWLSHFWAVESWFASIIGIPADQITTPEVHWKILCTNGSHQLSPSIFLSNREIAQEGIRKLLGGDTSQIKIVTHHPDQVSNFVSAFIASLEEKERTSVYNKCLYISGVEAWNVICDQYREHILVASSPLDLSTDESASLISKAKSAGHKIIYYGLPGGIPSDDVVPLPNPTIDQLIEPLMKSGYDFEQAHLYAKRSGGNIISILNIIKGLPLTPSWSRGSYSQELSLALLLGAWNDGNEADRIAIEKITGENYSKWIGRIRAASHQLGTPLGHQDGRWTFTVRYEGWYALGENIYEDHLELLKDIAVRALREKDPKFELSKDVRAFAKIYGKVLTHSPSIRNGLASCLALLGSQSRAITSVPFRKVEDYAKIAVSALLEDADWNIWASLNDELPLLAEAAPRQFLDSVEEGLRRNPCPFDGVFAQESSDIFGRNYISGLLWALETLAWNVDHFSSAVDALVGLTERDPGGGWANRPANSIVSILLPRYPQTLASFEMRYSAICRLFDRNSAVGWKILMSLLPPAHFISNVRRPVWRDWIPEDWEIRVSRKDYDHEIEAYTRLAIDKALNNLEYLLTLCDRMGNFSPESRNYLLSHLVSDQIIGIEEKERTRIWNKLVDLIQTHRMHVDSDWAFSASELEPIENVASKLAPKEPIYLHKRLFEKADFELFTEIDNYDQQRERVASERCKAISDILEYGGIQAVLEFAQTVDHRFEIGFALGSLEYSEFDSIILPKMILSEQKEDTDIAYGFIRGRFVKYGWVWVDNIEKKDWTSEQIAMLFVFLPFNEETWKRSELLLGADARRYWISARVNPYEAKSNIDTCIDNLIKIGRPREACRCVYYQIASNQKIDNTRAISALTSSLRSSEPIGQLDGHETKEIIYVLQKDPNTDANELLILEWAYLPLLENDEKSSPMALEKKLCADPEFFCEMVRLSFKPRKTDCIRNEPSEQEEKVAANAYRLLDIWTTVPGQKDDGTFNGVHLTTWLDSVKKRCDETGHLSSAMIVVGQVLVMAPPDPDGLWIHRSVAKILDAYESEDIRRGYYSAFFRNRSKYAAVWSEEIEAKRAIDLRKKAEEVELAGFIRLSSLLKELVERCERNADFRTSLQSSDRPF